MQLAPSSLIISLPSQWLGSGREGRTREASQPFVAGWSPSVITFLRFREIIIDSFF